MSIGTEYEIYVDGACSGNPGPGGWGAVIHRWDGETRVETIELSGGVEETTNNRMELTAAIAALKSLPYATSATIYTDSRYMRDGITDWIIKWKQKNWRRGNRPVKNTDLWQQLDAVNSYHTTTWHWVKGHADNPGNIRADELATGAIPFITAEHS
ncbi:MAG: ribonuclease HI [Rhodobacteraceae bacterium]|nr:ribonuclease HI [Paracoccaceae bacterium]